MFAGHNMADQDVIPALVKRGAGCMFLGRDHGMPDYSSFCPFEGPFQGSHIQKGNIGEQKASQGAREGR